MARGRRIATYAEPVQISHRCRPDRRAGLCRGVRRSPISSNTSRARSSSPFRPTSSSRSRQRRTAARRWPARRASDEALVELFLDMLAAERGAGENTLDAYRSDLADLAAHLRAAGRTHRRRHDRRPARLSRRARRARLQGRRRWRGGCRRCGSCIRFLYAEGKRSDDPAAVLEGPKRGRALPKVLSIAEVDGLLKQARADAEDAEAAAGRAAARGAAAVSARSRLRHRLARLRAGGLAGLGRASATSACWSCAARAARSGWCRSTRRPSARWRVSRRCAARPSRDASRNGCSPRSARPAI